MVLRRSNSRQCLVFVNGFMFCFSCSVTCLSAGAPPLSGAGCTLFAKSGISRTT